MKLHRQAVEPYTLDIATTPAVTGPWSASFDNRATWRDGAPDGQGWQWIVAGPDATDPGDAAVVSGTVFPLVRHLSDPIVIIDDNAPRITVYP